MFIACGLLLLALGVGTVTGGSNHILYTTANAQLGDAGELIGEQILEEEEEGQKADQTDQAPTTNGLSLRLDQAHFIPLSPISDSPGNQVKMLLDYSVLNPSTLLSDKMNAIMEVYAENQTLLRTSSLPEPIELEDSEGSIQLATTFDDLTLQNVTARALLTDGLKINPLSDPLEASISLGEIRSEDTSDLEK